MSVTPEQIEGAGFTTAKRGGYRTEEVDGFLKKVAEEYRLMASRLRTAEGSNEDLRYQRFFDSRLGELCVDTTTGGLVSYRRCAGETNVLRSLSLDFSVLPLETVIVGNKPGSLHAGMGWRESFRIREVKTGGYIKVRLALEQDLLDRETRTLNHPGDPGIERSALGQATDRFEKRGPQLAVMAVPTALALQPEKIRLPILIGGGDLLAHPGFDHHLRGDPVGQVAGNNAEIFCRSGCSHG